MVFFALFWLFCGLYWFFVACWGVFVGLFGLTIRAFELMFFPFFWGVSGRQKQGLLQTIGFKMFQSLGFL